MHQRLTHLHIVHVSLFTSFFQCRCEHIAHNVSSSVDGIILARDVSCYFIALGQPALHFLWNRQPMPRSRIKQSNRFVF